MSKKGQRSANHSLAACEHPKTLAYYSYHLFPTERAHTIQVMSMCEAFQQLGLATTLFACRNPEYPQTTGAQLLDQYGVRGLFDVKLLDGVSSSVWSHRRLCFFSTYRTCKRYELCITRSMMPALACAIRRVPCILEVHHFHLGITDRRVLAVLNRSACVRFVAISAALAESLSTEWGIPRARIAVEHDGFRAASGATSDLPAEMDYDVSRDRLKALYAGSFYPGRGVELIYELAALHPDLDFVLVGAPADYSPPAFANKAQNVFVFPRLPHPSMPTVLAMADLLLMPYGKRVTIDGLGDTSQFCSPLKLFEYLGAGLPIVASRLPAIQEVLIDGENALLAEPDNVGDWSIRLGELKSDPALRRRLGRAALSDSSHYTWVRRAERLLQGVANG